MSMGLVIGVIILCIVLIIIAFIWGTYNSLVKLNERVDEAWSDITVQLKYRADLIPNVVETVKGYAKHESEAIKAVSEARAKMMGARTMESMQDADRSVTGALSRLMAVTESYPELKADANFRKLQEQLTDVEDKLQAARRFYNNGVKEMNTKIKVFPVNIFNGFGFKQRQYFEVEDPAQIENAPEVKF